MTNMPWGPHGPEVPPHTVLPNPTAPSPPQQILGSGEAPEPIAAAGGGGALGTILANIMLSLVLLMLLWIPMVCLYPLTAVAGMVAGFGTFPLFLRVLPADGRDVAAVLGLAVGVVVGLKMNRLEYRLAQNPVFRLSRHALRLVLLAVWAVPIIQLSTGTTAPTTSTAYILAVVSSPRALAAFLSQPRNLLIWVAAVVGLHFLIWSGDGVRRWWHRRLMFIGLK
jgi:hypothetical protein